MLAFTGLETVANLAEEARRPGVDLPRSRVRRDRAPSSRCTSRSRSSRSRRSQGRTPSSATRWIRSPLMGVATKIGDELPSFLGDALRVYVGLTGALILLAAVTTSISGFSRLAYSLGEHGQLPRELRPAQPPGARLAARDRRGRDRLVGDRRSRRRSSSDDVSFLASLFSFGVLLAFTAAQLAVIKLRVARARSAAAVPRAVQRAIRGAEIPLPAIVGAIGTFAVWILALATHPAARYAGPGMARARARRLRRGPHLARRGADGARDVADERPARAGGRRSSASSCR